MAAKKGIDGLKKISEYITQGSRFDSVLKNVSIAKKIYVVEKL